MSSETENKRDAEKMLKDLEGRAARGEIMPTGRRLMWEDVRDTLLTHYRSTGKRDVKEVEPRLKHLNRYFRGWRANQIDGPAIAKYIEARQAEVRISPVQKIAKKPAAATINREVGVLMRALRLAAEHKKLAAVPIVHLAKEAAPRKGFFEVGAFEAIRAKLAPDLQLAVSIAYELGWRTQSEVLTLELRQIDLDRKCIRLDPGSTKNDDAREVYLTSDLTNRLRVHIERVHELERATNQIITCLFPHFPARRIPPRRVGSRRVDFRRAWENASREAGYPGAIRHDFRRTAVRSLVNAGVPEKVAMDVTGHKTRSVFDRYHIVSPADLQRAAEKLEAARSTLGTTTVTTGTVTELRPRRKDGTTGT